MTRKYYVLGDCDQSTVATIMIDPLLAAKQRSHFHFKTSDRTADWRKLNEYSDVGNECLDVIYECPDVNKECQDVCHKCLDVIYRMS